MWPLRQPLFRRPMISYRGILGLILTITVFWWVGDRILRDSLAWPTWGVAALLLLVVVVHWLSLMVDSRLDRLESELKDRHGGRAKETYRPSPDRRD